MLKLGPGCKAPDKIETTVNTPDKPAQCCRPSIGSAIECAVFENGQLELELKTGARSAKLRLDHSSMKSDPPWISARDRGCVWFLETTGNLNC